MPEIFGLIGAGGLLLALLLAGSGPSRAGYTNFESAHVHPLALTPSGQRLLAVNTPDARLEVFAVDAAGKLAATASVPVGLEPVSVTVRGEDEAWVVNHLSDSVSIVDLSAGAVAATLPVADEPVDVAFASGRAFVASSREDRVQVFDLADLAAAPVSLPLLTREPRALAVSPDGSKVYAVALKSGNRTTVINAGIPFNDNDTGHDNDRLAALGLHPMECVSTPPDYPDLPDGIDRNPALTDPPPFLDPNGVEQPGVPPVGLIVRWDEAAGRWVDEDGQDWSDCLPFRLPDHDLFVIDAATLSVSTIDHLGTSLLDVSVNPADGRIWVPHTEARNFVRFEHPLGVAGHVVDNRMAVVDPADAFSVTLIDLNGHVDRSAGATGPAGERAASLSQPAAMAWQPDGAAAWLTAIGSSKLFRLDGSCLAPACIFGADRSNPVAVEVGAGATGVVLRGEQAYVLNRFTNRIVQVDTALLQVTGETALHDPSGPEVRQGRRFLYEAISGHGDGSCASCHLYGDMDGLAWDLGDPEGDFTPYSDPNDNVRFIVPIGNQPVECDPLSQPGCASHQGFDPQKGPMATQTFRRMLEPLHWRFDRATLLDFNPAFVGLLGAPDIGPVNGKPAGLTAEQMQAFREFALGIHFPPSPFRTVLDRPLGAPGDPVGIPLPGLPFTGNPLLGETLYFNHPSDAGQTCASCHALPFGAAGGQVGGVTPTNPTSAAATALFNGTPDGSLHSDMGVPHLRNMYEKFGPVFGDHAGPAPARPAGFGFTHDGSIPDMGTFLSAQVFNLDADQVRHISAFMYAFPTGTRPAVGRHLTFPPGPAGDPATDPDEQVLRWLIQGADPADPSDDLGDLANPQRHCELIALAVSGGVRRSYVLAGGVWQPDAAGEAAVATDELRTSASGPVSFLCAPLDSGSRLGGDRDEDGILNRDDCAEGDAGSFAAAAAITDLSVVPGPATSLAWSDQAAAAGPGMRYDVAGLSAGELRSTGLAAASCLAAGLESPGHLDERAGPPAGEAWLYLSQARNGCGAGGYGTGGEAASRPDLSPGPCASP